MGLFPPQLDTILRAVHWTSKRPMQPVDQERLPCRLSPKPSTVRWALSKRAVMTAMSLRPFALGAFDRLDAIDRRWISPLSPDFTAMPVGSVLDCFAYENSRLARISR